MRSLLQQAERGGVLIVIPDDITQKLTPTITAITNSWDLISVLARLKDEGVIVVKIEEDSLLDMTFAVTQPLGIKSYKLGDVEFIAPDSIPAALKMRLNLLDLVTVKELEESVSFFTRIEGPGAKETADQALANAVNTLAGIGDELDPEADFNE